jgi:hypothetical protein
MTGLAFGQSLILDAGGTYSGSGNFTVADSIRNISGGTISIAPKVTLNKSGSQVIGGTGENAIVFTKLVTSGSGNKSQNVAVTVSDTLNVGSGTTYVVGTSTLNIDSAATIGGTFNASGAGTVNYRQSGGAQTIIGTTYGGTLGLSGNASKSFSADATAAALSHSGGGLTANHNLTVSGNATIGTLTNVYSLQTFTLNGTSTISTLSNNQGTITGNGAITFTNAATNGGAITGGAGGVTFSSSLAHNAGTITAGSGGIDFNGAVTNGSTITAGNTYNLDFNSTIVNTGTISLSATATANFGGSITNTGSLTFASGTIEIFDGTALRIPTTTYGSLTVAGSGTDTASGAVTALGNLTLNNNLRMASTSDSLIFTNAASNLIGSNEVIGKVTRNHTFAAGTNYSFNRDSVTLAFTSSQSNPVTIGMYPATSPTNPLGLSYVNRRYSVYSTADLSGNPATVKLYYTDPELNVALNENKLVIRKYDGSSWTQYGAGDYTRTVSGATNTIRYATITVGFAGIVELGMFSVQWITKNDGDFNSTNTWEGGVIPGIGDDILIKHNVALSDNHTVDNVTIYDTTGAALNLTNGNFTAGGLMNSKTLSISSGRTLTLSSTCINTSSGAFTISGIATLSTVDNSGAFTLNTGSSATSGAFTNQSGSSLITNSGGSLAVTGNLRNRGAITNNGAIMVQ